MAVCWLSARTCSLLPRFCRGRALARLLLLHRRPASRQAHSQRARRSMIHGVKTRDPVAEVFILCRRSLDELRYAVGQGLNVILQCYITSCNAFRLEQWAFAYTRADARRIWGDNFNINSSRPSLQCISEQFAGPRVRWRKRVAHDYNSVH